MTTLADRLRASFAASSDHQPGIYTEDLRDLMGPIDQLRDAAVLVPIIDAPVPRVVLTVRHAGMRAHAGQVAFPGGRLDPEDDGPIAGALREAWEEIALPPDRVDVIGVGRRYATGSGYMITPVVGVIPDGLDLTPHEAEVATLFEVPLELLLSETHQLRKTMEYYGRERIYYEIDWPDHRIWGVTAGLIVDLTPRLREAVGSPA